MYRLTAIEGAEQKAAQAAAPVWLYCHAFESPLLQGRMRSPHTVELPFVFGHAEGAAREFTGATPQATALMHLTMDVWVRFARSGNPNGAGFPVWPAFTRECRETMQLSAAGAALQFDPGAAARELMARHPRFEPGSPINYNRPA